MIFEFLIAYRRAADTKIVDIIRDSLAEVLEENLNEFDDETINQIVIPRIERLGDETAQRNFLVYRLKTKTMQDYWQGSRNGWMPSKPCAIAVRTAASHRKKLKKTT